MDRVHLKKIPEEIGDLVHLKYLGLMGPELYSPITIDIPASIGKLKKLQTLHGRRNTDYTVPKEICELHELRHLHIQISGSLNIGTHQTKLQTLDRIEYKEWMKIDTVNLTNLHTLSICDKDDEEEEYSYTLESVANLTSLQTLALWINVEIPTLKPLSSCNRLKSVSLLHTLKDPSELRHLPDSITDLSLIGSELTEDPMPTLGSLLNLTALELGPYVYMGNKMVCSENGFPSLQILRLKELEELEVGDGAFPSLKQFQRVGCLKLKNIPVQLAERTVRVFYFSPSMEDIEMNLAELDIANEENEELSLDEGVEEEINRFELCLVGRFLTEKSINARAMKSKMADLWKPAMGINIKDLKPGLFLFQFYHKDGMILVNTNGPWTFDGALLVLNVIKAGEDPIKVSLHEVDFWIHIHDLPVGYMSEVVGKQLGNFSGTFLLYDTKNNSSIWREYMRLRIRVDRFCQKRLEAGSDEVSKEWGQWLRAQPRSAAGGTRSRWLRDDGDGDWGRKTGLDNHGAVTDLRLRFSELRADPMSNLGSLSNLTALELYGVYKGNKMVCSENGFPSLQILRLDYFPDLEELEVEDRAFPSLKQFKIWVCPKLKKIPVQLAEQRA
ncbi:hypothetical protein AgCh_023488 [Apium graveolens]